MSGIAQQAAPEAEAAPYRWRWAAFAVVLAGSVMDLLDSLATNVAYGRRRVLLAGMAGFTIGSVLCSIATQPGELIAFRVVQGLFGAIMLPQGLGVIRASFPPKELPVAFGAFGPVMGLSSVGGPVLAGWLIGADYLGTGWRMIFLINVPIGLAAFLGGLRFLPRTQEATASRLDIVGAVLVAAAAGLLVYPVVQGRELGWPAWTFLLMAVSVVVFTVFGTVFFDLLTSNLHAHASQQAFTRTLGQTLWVAVALQAATFALAFLLPRRARPQWNGVPDPGDGTSPDSGQATTPAAEPA
jgi:MFS family permease